MIIARLPLRTAPFFFIFFLSFFIANAQKDTFSVHAGGRKSIVVIPFEPYQYFNDGDQFICQNNNITPAQLNGIIRKSLDKILVEGLSADFNARSISDTSYLNRKSDQAMIYSMTRYTMEDGKVLKGYSTNVDNNKLKTIFNIGGKTRNEDYVSSTRDVKRRHRYFKASFISDSVAGVISQRYNENYFLFISHFEMETSYKDCHDMANNAFQRNMYVHYTFIDAKNNFIDGGVVCVVFKSSDKEINDILEKNFGILSTMIIDQIKTKI